MNTMSRKSWSEVIGTSVVQVILSCLRYGLKNTKQNQNFWITSLYTVHWTYGVQYGWEFLFCLTKIYIKRLILQQNPNYCSDPFSFFPKENTFLCRNCLKISYKKCAWSGNFLLKLRFSRAPSKNKPFNLCLYTPSLVLPL